MVEEILITNIAMMTGGCYFWGVKDGKEGGDSGRAPMNTVGSYNLLALISLEAAEIIKNYGHWEEEIKVLAITEPALLIPLALGILAVGTLALAATGVVPQVLYEKGLSDGNRKFQKKKEEENEI